MASTATSPASNPVGHIHTGLPLPSNLRQIEGLQVLRAFAVFQIAWAHIGQDFNSPHGVPPGDFGIFGIDLFFVISGFILSTIVLRSREQPGTHAAWGFLKRRLIRIFPIYLIFVALTALRVLHAHHELGLHYLPSVLLLPSPIFPRWWMLVPVAWTLVYEMFFYYFLSAVQLFTVRRAVPAMILLLTAAVALGRIGNIRHPYLIVAANPILLEFVFGAILALIYRRLGTRRLLGIALVLIGVIFVFAVKRFLDTGAISMWMILTDDRVTHRAFTWGLAAAFIVAGIVFWSPSSKRPLWRAAVVVGDASYSAYLASPLVLEFSGRALQAAVKSHTPSSVASISLCWLLLSGAVLAAGWLSYQFIEWPLLRRLQARFLAQKPVHASA